MDKPRILVHICCAPDALYVVQVLQETFNVAGYFYNPNIFPAEEYARRLAETQKVARMLGFHLLEKTPDRGRWLRLTEKFRNEPEKGRRCDICYAVRLEETARKASELQIDFFATIMSLSPWKKADVLNRMGKMFARKYHIRFLEANFKKKGGFQKSIELSRCHGLYRQNYCGCLPSALPAASSHKDESNNPL
ncbi:MAG: epoxyqueuosine reductase QueH [Candidatus Aminicenantales bacterium]